MDIIRSLMELFLKNCKCLNLIMNISVSKISNIIKASPIARKNMTNASTKLCSIIQILGDPVWP